jgi:hypothetical protein
MQRPAVALMPIPEQQNRIVGVAGRKGSGKSTKAKEILQQCNRLFIYDTMGEHRWIPDRFTDLESATMYLMESHCYSTFMGSIVPESDDESAEFSEICDLVYEQGNMCFAVEEVAMLDCSANYAPPKFKRIMRLGRHQNLDVLYTTQRLEECPVALRSATDVFVLLSHTDPLALEAISKRCGPEIARKVAAFGLHEFLIYDVNQRRELDEVVLTPFASAV